MITAGAYVLKVPEGRREILLDDDAGSWVNPEDPVVADLGDRFGSFHRSLSKFAHPTAGLVHGITHQVEACRQLQAVFTTQGVYYAAQGTLALEAQLGISQPE